MKIIDQQKLESYISTSVVDTFNKKRLSRLRELDILRVLKNKNPYLFKAKSLNTPEEIVKSILEAYLSSQEETFFGDIMEGLAVYVCQEVFGGIKLGKDTNGNPDIIFLREGITYFVEVKSGPKWGNSSQLAKLKITFKRLRQELIERGEDVSKYEMVNGCIYGKENNYQRSDSDRQKHYLKICGQAFWELISGSPTFYTDIVLPLSKETSKKDETYKQEFDSAIIRSARIFSEHFLSEDRVNWEKLISYISKNID